MLKENVCFQPSQLFKRYSTAIRADRASDKPQRGRCLHATGVQATHRKNSTVPASVTFGELSNPSTSESNRTTLSRLCGREVHARLAPTPRLLRNRQANWSPKPANVARLVREAVVEDVVRLWIDREANHAPSRRWRTRRHKRITGDEMSM